MSCNNPDCGTCRPKIRCATGPTGAGGGGPTGPAGPTGTGPGGLLKWSGQHPGAEGDQAAYLPDGANLLVLVDTDTGSELRAATAGPNPIGYTVPAPGYTIINAEINAYVPGGGDVVTTGDLTITILKNGLATPFTHTYTGPSAGGPVAISALLSYSAGDTIEVLAQATGALISTQPYISVMAGVRSN